MMATLNMLFKRTLSALPFVFIVQSASASVTDTIPVERDFDTIREYQSYDPATDKWSKVEDFDTVDILDDLTEQREDNYIYHSFWAYDAVTKSWHKVDIRDYGYRRRRTQLATTHKKVVAKTGSSGFWNKIALGLRGGAGGMLYIHNISNFSIVERNNQYFLQSAQQKKLKEKSAYEAQWFGNSYKITKLSHKWKQQGGKVNEVDGSNKIVLRGEGLSFPVTGVMHYTSFNGFRLGVGGVVEINHLEELVPQDAGNLSYFKVADNHQWFVNAAWFGLVGARILHAPQADIFLDLQVGKNYNLGSLEDSLEEIGAFHYNGWMVGAGATYEHKLNNYFKALVRVGANWRIHDDTPKDDAPQQNEEDDSASVYLHQIAGHIDLGIQCTFGKATEEVVY